MQRLLDILLATAALVLLSPLLLVVAVVLRCTGEGDVFYRQERVGLHGRLFGLLKFATMLRDSPKIGAGEITLKNDPRVLPVGRFLRKTKLNELPQLWNIIVGDLSVVGPRPMVPNTFAAYPPDAQTILNTARPGLSGVGSIIFRDEESFLAGRDDPTAFYRDTIIPYKAALECWYVRHQGLKTYGEVIVLTLWAILFKNTQLPWRVWSGLPEPPTELTSSPSHSS
jgi:lipopolysaccharide/colanic/teichoic acid biosynthesis glycosyltransferase